MKRTLAVTGLVFVFAASAMAQSEGDLKRYFEGRKVKVLIDMPATQEGVNVYPERGQPLEFSSYAGRIKQFGIGVKEGETLMITKIRVKEKHIEFQLGGGGYGTIGDEGTISQWTDGIAAGFEGKSKKEERLEGELKKESDPNRRRQLREDIDTLRRDREREDRRIRAERAASLELGKQRIEERRTYGGSRFNIRFGSTPGSDQLTPAAIMKALREYLEFPWQAEGNNHPR
jgi:hypothetical protein